MAVESQSEGFSKDLLRSRQFAILIGHRTTLEARSFYVAFPPALLQDSILTTTTLHIKEFRRDDAVHALFFR